MPTFKFDEVQSSLVTYQNPQFAMLEKCLDTDRNMTWREWIKNAIEAAVKDVMDNLTDYKGKKATIYVRALPVNGLLYGIDHTKPKLGTMQPGGMDWDHLQNATKMSCSHDKQQGIKKGNRGNGIRITASLHTDILFITRKNGKSLMRLIGWRGSKEQKNFFQTRIERCDQWVNDNAKDRSYPAGDFTEVIFMGVESAATQNTLLYPFGESEKQSKRTCISTIFKRFWQIPNCVEIAFQTGKDNDSTPHSAGFKSRTKNLYFKTWLQSFEESQKTVTTGKDSIYRTTTSEDGYKLHQFVEAPQENGLPSSAGITSSHDSKNFSAQLWGEQGNLEMYNVVTGSRAIDRLYGKFGIINGQNLIKFFLEMPFDKYQEDPTRKYIVADGDASNTHVNMFSEDIVSKMKEMIHPDVQAKINDLNKDVETDNIDDLIREELQQYIDDNLDVAKSKTNKKIVRKRKKVVKERDPKICPDCGTQVKHNVMECPTCQYKWESRKKSAVQGNNKEGMFDSIVPPQFDHLQGKSIDNANMRDTFAKMHRMGGENDRDLILLNTEHSVIDKFVRKLKNYDDDLEVYLRDEALKILKVKLAVFTILAKGRYDKGSIDDTQLESLFSDVVLTMTAEQHNDAVPRLKGQISNLKAMLVARQNDGSTIVNKDVITDGSDARDTESKSKLTPEEQARFVTAGGKLPTKE